MPKAAIPITRPVIGPEEFRAVQLPLESGWVVQGPFVKEFERRFCEFSGASYASATSSCTTALHLAVAALGLQPGDEVVVPSFTWVATPNVVEYMGATPVFCDIDLSTFNLDVERLESAVTPRTVGIIPVHLFGLCADMDAIAVVARKHKLWIVEDAACAFGAHYRGRHAGTFGDAGCFSFHPRKAITTGEGGMVATHDRGLDATVRSLRDHGASRSDLTRHEGSHAFLLAEYGQLGYNYRMTDIQGSLGCAQMNRAAGILQERSRLAQKYKERLSHLAWLVTPQVPEEYVHGYQAYVCLFRPEEPNLQNYRQLREDRNRLMAALEEDGIATRQGTHAPVTQGFYREKYKLRVEDFPNAVVAEALSLTLPLFPGMSDEEHEHVSRRLEEVFASV